MLRNAHKQRGVSLLELVVVLAIIGIISALAIYSYTGAIDKSRRREAQRVLHQLAFKQEEFFIQHYRYATDADSEWDGWLGQTDAQYYEYSVVADVQNTGVGYQLTAEATADQAGDVDCQTMTLDSIGRETPAVCWR